MEQPIILDKVLIVDDNQTYLLNSQSFSNEAANDVFQSPAQAEDFEVQEQWINAIAYMPFLIPEHTWKSGKLQVCINFIPAEPCIVDDELI